MIPNDSLLVMDTVFPASLELMFNNELLNEATTKL